MKKLFCLITICLLSLSSFAQDDKEEKVPGARIEALKIAYLTKKLNLSPEEAQKFWPIYNQYSDDIRKVRQEARQNQGKEIETDEKILNLRKKYNGEFSKALSTEKVNSFFRAEKDFSNYLQKEMLERRQQRMDQRKRLRQ